MHAPAILTIWVLLAGLITLGVGVARAGEANAAAPAPKDTTAVLFSWTWNAIARECTDTLGPAGYGYVQTSPPQEHVLGSEWWTYYQPVSYRIESRLGTRAEFAAMVDTCHAAGVKVIADAVINHMSGKSGGGTGWAGSTFQHYDYPGIYSSQDFHSCRRDISNYQDRWEVQECNLVNLSDLNTSSSYVQGKIAGYLNDLVSLGVDGFRIDAVKHIASADLQGILGRVNDRARLYLVQEVIRANEPIQPEEYTAYGDIHEFAYARKLKEAFGGGTINWLISGAGIGPSWSGFLPQANAAVFVDNHDTERNGETLSYKDGSKYDLAQIFTLAWNYGSPSIHSGYQFSNKEAGPALTGNGEVIDPVCGQNGWTCKHAQTSIENMVGFRNATSGTAVTSKWDNGSNAIAFGRGDKGFVVINNGGGTLDRTFQTSLPAGTYCNVIVGLPTSTGCSAGGTVTVAANGTFTAGVGANTALALHVGAKAGSTPPPTTAPPTTAPPTTPPTEPPASGTLLKVYYSTAGGWSTTNVHYRVGTGSWTTVPGAAMAAACAGWVSTSIELGTSAGITAAFNNGSGVWDNNGGKDYALTGTIATVKGGVIGSTDPCATTPPTTPPPTAPPTTTPDPVVDAVLVYYRADRNWPAYNVHYQVGTGSWTSVPGVPMAAACTGWVSKRIAIGTATGINAVFTNGTGTWDNNAGRNYAIAEGTWRLAAGVLTAGSPCPNGPEVPVEPATTPSVPIGLTATADSTSQVSLAWEASTDDEGVASYDLERSGGVTGTAIFSIAGATSRVDTGLTAATGYAYRVRAVDTDGQASAWSSSVSVRTKSGSMPAASGEPLGGDPREDSIYFIMTARWNDGDASNDRGGSQHVKSGNAANDDPMFRGDFQGVIDKLDYIKGLGFSAVWITPVVLNRSDYDFHGYHGWDFFRVDPRLESEGASYQDLIDEAHARGIKIYQDVVYNHSSRWGAKGLFVPTVWGDRDGQWDWMYSQKEAGREYDPTIENDGADPSLTAAQNALAKGRTYNGDLWSKTAPADSTCANFGTLTMYKSPEGFGIHNCQWPSPTSGMFPSKYYHQCWIGNWEGKDAQDCWLHDDLADFNTESKPVQDYLIDAYNSYIDMGVDGFRIDTAVHIPRVTWNRRFLPAIRQHATEVHGAKGEDFYVFGEVASFVNDKWNRGSVNHSAQFYTWQERREYSLDDVVAAAEQFQYENLQGTGNQPTSDNAFLTGTGGNTYHAPDHSKFSGMNVIDMRMHMNFGDASNAFHNGKDSDDSYNDATYNPVYVDSHDYGPNKSSVRYNGGTEAWAENMSLMWTFRGIPTLYYGSEIEFQAGKPIDCGPTCPLATTGRAYFGDHLEGSVVASDFGVVSSASGEVAHTLEHPLVEHVQTLNRIRRAVPALQKGQYSTQGVSGDMAYKRRFTDAATGVDSFVLVTVSNGASFSGIPNGTYTDAVTGDVKVVSNGTLTASLSGKGNLRAYVLALPGNPAPGKVGTGSDFLK